jgi:acyl-CoA synthetase (AMP-forming)/AMP-acid ligase II
MQRLSPYAVLKQVASRQPDHDAIVFDDNSRLTYGEFAERVTALVGWLLNEGFVPGEAAGICIRDEINHLVASMAVLCMDTAQISLASHESATTRRALAERVGVSQLIVEAPEAWMEGLRTIEMPATGTEVVRGFRSGLPNAVCQGCTIDSVAIYQNTSGSTNVPKTFGLSLERVFRLSARYAGDEKERRVLRTGSIEFDPHRLHRLCSLLAGNSSLFLRHLNLQNFVEFCAREQVTAVHMGGYKLGALVRSGTQTGRLPAFTTIHTGGARVPGSLRKRLKSVLTDNLYVIYATSEIGLISCATPDQHESFPEGVGFPATSLTLEIIGADGDQVAPGEIGQIRVRKVGMFNDYVVAPGANANFQEGWFYPRDLVSLMPGEPLIFYGRADDVMILNGINIFPSAIEDVLENHPGVKEAVAYAVKSRVHGEIPVAAVVLKDAAEPSLASDLLNHCRQALGIRAPRQIVVLDRIPRNAAGKPLRRELSGS